MKKVLALIVSFTMVFGMFSTVSFAKTTKAYEPSGTLTIWSFTDEVQKMAVYYTKQFPKVKINYVMTPTAQYPGKLTPALQSGTNVPDVFALESAFVKGYITPDTGLLADLSSLRPAMKAAGTLKYVQDVATDENGVLRGASWQGTPGALFYRRSLAKKYLGTDDPVKVQSMVNTFAKFEKVGEKIKALSSGKVKLLSSLGDLYYPYKAARKTGFVKDNKFVVDSKINDYFATSKLFKDKGLEAEQAQWGEGWFAGMNDSLKDAKGNPQQIFAYLLPTWGLSYVLKPNATNAKTKVSTAGDWAMCTGPSPYFWGGTWLAASAKSKNLELAKHFIQWLTTDQTFLTQYAKDSGDFLGEMTVVNKIKNTYKEPFLGGQNHYAAFAQAAPSINASTLTGYDQDIETLMNQQLTLFVNNKKSLAQAMKDWKAAVANQFSDLEVK